MKDQIHLSRTFKLGTGILIGVGLVTFIAGFITDPDRTWANYLLNNYYFLMLALGAAFLAEGRVRQVAGARVRGTAQLGAFKRLDRFQRRAGGVFDRLLGVHRPTYRTAAVDAGAAGLVGEADEV